MATEQRRQADGDRVEELARQLDELRDSVRLLRQELKEARSTIAVERHYLYTADPNLALGRSPQLPPRAEPEYPVPGWRHLVYRPHPRRHQLSVRGRNLTVRQLVGSIKANKLN